MSACIRHVKRYGYGYGSSSSSPDIYIISCDASHAAMGMDTGLGLPTCGVVRRERLAARECMAAVSGA